RLVADARPDEGVAAWVEPLHLVPLGLLADRVGALRPGEVHLVDDPRHRRLLTLPHLALPKTHFSGRKSKCSTYTGHLQEAGGRLRGRCPANGRPALCRRRLAQPPGGATSRPWPGPWEKPGRSSAGPPARGLA